MANRGPHGKAPVGAGRGKMDFKVLGRLMKQVFHDYPVHLTVVLVCIVLTALINVAPAAYIETITSYIEEGLGSGWDAILPKLLSALVTMTALYVVNIILTTVYTQLMAHVTQGFLHKTRERMFSTMQRLPISYFDRTPRGDIMSRFTNDTDSLRQVISQSLPNLIASGLTVIGVVCMMLYFSMPLMVVVILGIICMTLATKNIGGKSAKYFVRQQNSLGKAEGFIEEMMNGQKVVKVFCHEQAAEADFDKLNDQLFADTREANRFANIFMPIMNNIGNLLYVLTAFAGGLLVTLGSSVPNVSIQNLVMYGTLVAPLSISVVASYLGMCKQFTANVSQVSQQMNAVAMAVAGAGRIFELLDQQPESDEGTSRSRAAARKTEQLSPARSARANGPGSTGRMTARWNTGFFRATFASSTWTSAMCRIRRCFITCPFTPNPARSSPSSARPAQAKLRSQTSLTASTTSPTARFDMTASTSTTSKRRTSGTRSASCSRM